ncbi:hypothetical protein Hanom_Chr08g00694111 [Helianthus anomalus]
MHQIIVSNHTLMYFLYKPKLTKPKRCGSKESRIAHMHDLASRASRSVSSTQDPSANFIVSIHIGHTNHPLKDSFHFGSNMELKVVARQGYEME